MIVELGISEIFFSVNGCNGKRQYLYIINMHNVLHTYKIRTIMIITGTTIAMDKLNNDISEHCYTLLLFGKGIRFSVSYHS